MNKTIHDGDPIVISLTGGNMVNSSKGGIPKIWGETLLLLLLGID
jgi:hypothetical protein